MDFKAFGDKAKGMVEGAATSATTTATKMLDEFNEALPTMRARGFVVKDLHVGMGLLPEVGAKLVATTDSMDETGDCIDVGCACEDESDCDDGLVCADGSCAAAAVCGPKAPSNATTGTPSTVMVATTTAHTPSCSR